MRYSWLVGLLSLLLVGSIPSWANACLSAGSQERFFDPFLGSSAWDQTEGDDGFERFDSGYGYIMSIPSLVVVIPVPSTFFVPGTTRGQHGEDETPAVRFGGNTVQEDSWMRGDGAAWIYGNYSFNAPSHAIHAVDHQQWRGLLFQSYFGWGVGPWVNALDHFWFLPPCPVREDANPVPVPATLLLMGSGLIVAIGVRWRRKIR